jgi:hypothetical protein
LATFPEAVGAGKIKIAGEAMRLAELMALMDKFPDVRDRRAEADGGGVSDGALGWAKARLSRRAHHLAPIAESSGGTLRFAHPAI